MEKYYEVKVTLEELLALETIRRKNNSLESTTIEDLEDYLNCDIKDADKCIHDDVYLYHSLVSEHQTEQNKLKSEIDLKNLEIKSLQDRILKYKDVLIFCMDNNKN